MSRASPTKSRFSSRLKQKQSKIVKKKKIDFSETGELQSRINPELRKLMSLKDLIGKTVSRFVMNDDAVVV